MQPRVASARRSTCTTWHGCAPMRWPCAKRFRIRGYASTRSRPTASPPLVDGDRGSGDISASTVSRGEVDLATRAGAAGCSASFSRASARLTPTSHVQRELAARRTPLAWVSLESVEDAAALAEAVALTQATRNATRAAKVDVLVRDQPAVVPETHAVSQLARADSKFGVLPDELGAVIDAGGGRTRTAALAWHSSPRRISAGRDRRVASRCTDRPATAAACSRRRCRTSTRSTSAVAFPSPTRRAPSRFRRAAHFAAAAVRAELDELPRDARPARVAVEPGRAVVAEAAGSSRACCTSAIASSRSWFLTPA